MQSTTERFSRSLQSMAGLILFVEKFLASFQVSGEINTMMVFVAEELFTNMVKYNPNGPAEITATLSTGDGKLVLLMEDWQEKPFDPTKLEEVDIDRPLSDRKPGGLGLFLIGKMMDEISYSFDNGVSRTTAVKYLENKNV